MSCWPVGHDSLPVCGSVLHCISWPCPVASTQIASSAALPSFSLFPQGLTWISDDKRELRSMLLRWAPAFGKALMCHLRKGEDLREELEVSPQSGHVLLHQAALFWGVRMAAGAPCRCSRDGECVHAARLCLVCGHFEGPECIQLPLPPCPLQGILLPHEIDGVLRAQHRPNYILQVSRCRAGGLEGCSWCSWRRMACWLI